MHCVTFLVIILRSVNLLFTVMGIWSSVAYVLKIKKFVLACRSSTARIFSTALLRTGLARSEYSTRVVSIKCAVSKSWSSLVMSILKASLADSLAGMVKCPFWCRNSQRLLAKMASSSLYNKKMIFPLPEKYSLFKVFW